MTPERARKILRAWRDDAASVPSAELAEALARAEEDPSLADWLDRQKEADARVRGAFAQIEPPASLRERVLARVAAGESTAADPPGETVPFAPPPTARPRLRRVAQVGSLAAALIALLGISLFLFDPSPVEAQPELGAFFDEARTRADPAEADPPAEHGPTVDSWSEARGVLRDEGAPTPAGMPAEVEGSTPLSVYSFRWRGTPVGAVVVEHPEHGRGTVFSIDRTVFANLSEVHEDPTRLREGPSLLLAWIADGRVHTLAFAGHP